jgi:ribonuclease Z
MDSRISRRDALKLSGAAALGGFGLWSGSSIAAWDRADPPPGLTQQNTLFKSLAPFRLGEPLAKDELRVSFMGTSPLERKAQAASSIFVELGNGDSFVFDAGMGCQINYTAMQVPASKMRKIFLTHLHGDHTSDLTYIYCFAAQRDGKSPLYLWGPSKSYVRNPWFQKTAEYQDEPEYFEDGTLEFARHFREMNRWHTESQSFVGTRWNTAEGDGYDVVATELNWATGARMGQWSDNRVLQKTDPPGKSSTAWVAYEKNGVRISYFPAVHDRNGSISYKLEWDTGQSVLSFIFSGDTKPNTFMLGALTAGQKVDLLVHEMVIPPDVWAATASGGGQASAASITAAMAVQENSHTPEKAFGYVLAEAHKVGKAPRLAVATHFQATDDTIRPALDNVRSMYAGPVTIATDLMVINVSKQRILQRRAVISDYSALPPIVDPRAAYKVAIPKYTDPRTDPKLNPYYPYGPLEQFSPLLLDSVIPGCNYDPAGFQCQYGYSAYDPPPNPPGVPSAASIKSGR